MRDYRFLAELVEVARFAVTAFTSALRPDAGPGVLVADGKPGTDRAGLSWMRRGAMVALLVAAPVFATASPEWTLLRDRDGIQVYSRPMAGSAIREIRAVTGMPATPDAVAAVLRNVSARPQWDHTCAKAYVHSATGPDAQILYFDLDLPWPVTDRDLVMLAKWQRDSDGKITFSGSAVNDVIPLKDDRVRIVQAHEYWELRPDAGGVTVTLTAHIDPAGPLPPLLVNSMSVDAPFDALGNLKKMVTATGR